MIQTSADYAPFAQVRQVDCLISFEVLAKTLNKKAIAVTAPSARVGSGPLTINGIPELAAKYGTLERYGWPLDGSCDILPSSGAETGYWSSAVSGDSGDFSSPVTVRYDLPSDTATFGWTFHFDAPAMITASLVRAVCYDAGGNVVDTAEGYVEGTVDPPRPTVTVGIEPVQAGSGDPSPDNVRPITGWTGAKVTRTGKNMAKFAKAILDADRFQNGITFHALSENTVRVSGTSTGNAFLTLGQSYETLVFESRYYPAGTYTMSSNLPRGQSPGSYVYMTGFEKDGSAIPGTIVTSVYNDHPVTFTRDTGFYANIQMCIRAGNDYTTPIDVWVQIEEGSTATDYEPYTGETFNIAFPTEAGTVYGGTLDVTSGVLTVDRAMVDLGTLRWTYNTTYAFFSVFLQGRKIGVTNLISDLFKTEPVSWSGTPKSNAICGDGSNGTIYVQYPLTDVADFMSLITGHQLVYELASPVTYQLAPVEISRILDTDNVWADCGPVLDIGSVPGNRPQIVKSGSGWSFHHYVRDYRAVEFTFYGTNLPRRMLRLAEIDFGVSKHFDRDSIKNARIKYGMTPDSSAFPAKEIVFTFDNSDGDFNVLNPIGVYQYWRNGQVLTARIKVGDEIVPMGMFYVTKAEIGENRLLAKVTAHDPCYQLANQKFYPMELAESATVRLDQAVPRALIGSDLEVDYGGLGAEPVSVAVRDTHDKRVILRYLAQAVRAAVWIDRDNVLRFRRIVTAAEEDGSITADELYNWSGVSIAEEFTGVTLTVARELQKDADGNDVTETYRSGALDSEGTHTATYENPCVAAASGQAVADWLLVTANRRKKYAVKNRCDPAVEIGDTLVIADAFHNDDRAVVTGLDIEFDGGLVCVTEADREF